MIVKKYYSDIEALKNISFDTEEAVLKAEEEYKAKIKSKEALEAEKNSYKKKIEEATKEVDKAYNYLSEIKSKVDTLREEADEKIDQIEEDFEDERARLYKIADDKVKNALENKNKALKEYCNKYGEFSVSGKEAEKYFDTFFDTLFNFF